MAETSVTLLTHPSSSLTYKLHSLVVFILTFLSYSLFHANRKTFSNLKSTISSEWSPSFSNKTTPELKPDATWNEHHLYKSFDDAELFLGILDTTFLFSYAIGLYISGVIGDRLPLRYILTFGMCGSGMVVFLFGVVTEWLQFYNHAFYICMWIINGLLQSTGWPTVVTVMGNWFGKSSRGLVLGVWSACASVGNIIGALIVAQVLDYGYDYAFMVTSVVLFCGGVVIFFGLIESPHEIGYPVADEVNYEINIPAQSEISPDNSTVSTGDVSSVDSLLNERSNAGRRKAITFLQAVLLPGVILYSLAYACLKLVNYSLFFWLPYYLSRVFGWEETVADNISIWYDVGGIVGGAVVGFLSDRMGKRAIVIIPTLALGIPSLFLFSHTKDSLVQNAGMLSLVGLFIGGVANLVSAAVAADLGRQGLVAGSAEALATVTGIVDGTGSMGAAAGQIIVPWVQTQYDWHVVFYIFIVATFLTGLCIGPMFINELKSLWDQGCCLILRKRRALSIQREEHRSLLSDDESPTTSRDYTDENKHGS